VNHYAMCLPRGRVEWLDMVREVKLVFNVYPVGAWSGGFRIAKKK